MGIVNHTILATVHIVLFSLMGFMFVAPSEDMWSLSFTIVLILGYLTSSITAHGFSGDSSGLESLFSHSSGLELVISLHR